ncbi:MAG: Gx transporter family protein [Clostridia bacterium]|nr:Gx transporter family protein [Clostridia bacterium]
MKKVALSGILVSMAIILAYVERIFPVGLIVPLPGIKLGLANIITLFALFYMDVKSAFTINILRCFIASMLFGSITSFIFSVSGAVAALAVMALLKAGYGRYFSIIGISIGGSAAHNIAQIFMASLVLKSTAVFAYLTVLLAASLATGLLTAAVCGSVLAHIDKLKL